MAYNIPTWNNVSAGSNGLAGIPSPQAGVNSSFDAFMGVIDRLQKGQDKGEQYVIDTNTEAAKTALLAPKTSTEYQQLMASGRLDQILAQHGNKIDRNAVRSLAESQLGTLQGRENAAYTAEQQVRARTEQPLIQALTNRIAQSNGEDPSLLDDINKSGITNTATLFNALNARKTAVGEGRIAALDLAGREQAEKDKAEQVSLATDLATAAALHRRQSSTGINVLTGESAGVQIPEELRAAKAAALIKNGKVPTNLSDTEATKRFIEEMSKSGKYSSRVLQAAIPGVETAFDRTSSKMTKGEDAVKQRLAAVNDELIAAEQLKADPYKYGSPDALGDYGTHIVDRMDKLIDKNTGWDPEEDIGSMQSWAQGIAINGVKVGKETVIPSIQMMEAAIRKADGGLARDGKRAKNAQTELENLMNSSFSLEQLEKGEKNRAIIRRKQVRELASSYKPVQ